VSAYCSSCGAPVPDGQSSCSMCYGDPDYGRDGYYREWIEAENEAEAAATQQAEDLSYCQYIETTADEKSKNGD
jgi:hypothetical protein